MRLWSIDPSYLDNVGLGACWRESLLAQAVLAGQTRGYRNHPQLERFRYNPLLMEQYLRSIHSESLSRGLSYDDGKIMIHALNPIVQYTEVTTGQLAVEFSHLQKKLWWRNRNKWYENRKRVWDEENIQANYCFRIVQGDKANWEKSNAPRIFAIFTRASNKQP